MTQRRLVGTQDDLELNALLVLGERGRLSSRRQHALLDLLLDSRRGVSSRALTRFCKSPGLSRSAFRRIADARIPEALEVLAQRKDLTDKEVTRLVTLAEDIPSLHEALSGSGPFRAAHYRALAAAPGFTSWVALVNNWHVPDKTKARIAAKAGAFPNDTFTHVNHRYTFTVSDEVARLLLATTTNLHILTRLSQQFEFTRTEVRTLAIRLRANVDISATSSENLWRLIVFISELCAHRCDRQTGRLLRDFAQEIAWALARQEAVHGGHFDNPAYAAHYHRLAVDPTEEALVQALHESLEIVGRGGARTLLVLQALQGMPALSRDTVSLITDTDYDEYAALIAWFCTSVERLEVFAPSLPPYFPLDAALASLPRPKRALRVLVDAVETPQDRARVLRMVAASRFLTTDLLLDMPASFVSGRLDTLAPRTVSAFVRVLETELETDADRETFRTLAQDCPLTVRELLLTARAV